MERKQKQTNKEIRNTVYVEQMNAWYDVRTKEEVLNSNIFNLVQKSIGTPGLVGLDKLLSFMIVKELQNFLVFLNKGFYKDAIALKLFGEFSKTISPVKGIVANPGKTYTTVISKLQKYWAPYTDFVVKVGQMQIIRGKIANELAFSCKFDSKPLFNALQTLNDTIMRDIEAHYKDPKLSYPSEDNPLLYELTSYLESTGISNPSVKIYITAKKNPFFSLLTSLLVIGQLSKLAFHKSLSGMMSKKYNDPLDSTAFVLGLVTLLKQYHSECTEQFISLLGQYVRSSIDANISNPKTTELSPEVINTLCFLEDFTMYGELSRKMVEAQVPAYIFEDFKHQSVQ